MKNFKTALIIGFIGVFLFPILIQARAGKVSSTYRSRTTAKLPVIIYDDDQKTTGFSSGLRTGTILNDLKIKTYPEDLISVFPDPSLSIGCQIEISRAIPLYFADGSNPKKLIRTQAKTVGELLAELKIELDGQDSANYSSSQKISRSMTLEITRRGTKEEKEEEVIPYQIVEQADPNLLKGKSRVVEEGEAGMLIKTFKVSYENGREIKRKLIDEEIKKPAQDKIVAYGTMVPVLSTRHGLIGYHSGDITASNYYATGAKLRITNSYNGKQVTVIVDSGCGHCGPIDKLIDLEVSAFQKVYPLYRGVFRAKVEELGI